MAPSNPPKKLPLRTSRVVGPVSPVSPVSTKGVLAFDAAFVLAALRAAIS